MHNPDLCFANARIVLEHEVITGSLHICEGQITAVGRGSAIPAGALDCAGDYLIPGLIELHTDNLERHMTPRPGVSWPLEAAIIAHDAELASVGITTVYDAIRIGSIETQGDKGFSRYARPMVDAVLALRRAGQLRIDHNLHLRAELCSETLLEEMAEFGVSDEIGLVSLMDHTPGHRQFRDASAFREYLKDRQNMTEQEIDHYFTYLAQLRTDMLPRHESALVEWAGGLGAVLASHDDTTLEHVATSQRYAVKVAEFPTTLEAAIASAEAGIAVMMGAPNLLRGGSHSGNVAAADLADRDVLHILSSDYVPASLLMGAFELGRRKEDLAAGVHTVTAAPAAAVGLTDRGRIEPGLRADLVRVAMAVEAPRTRGVWMNGHRIG